MVGRAEVTVILLLLPLLHAADFEAADAKIINGESAELEDYPMTGGMLMDATLTSQGQEYAFRMLICSSTLIAPDVVLLAGHCVDEIAFTYGQGDLEGMTMAWSRQADMTDWDGSRYRNNWPDDAVMVADWVENPDFDLMRMGLGVSENADVALLFLEEALTTVPLGYLPTREEARQIEEDIEVVVVGWGQQIATNGMEMPPAGSYAIKQQGISVISELGEFELQVGAETDDVRKCHGDSGGPTFMEFDTDSSETMRVIGVTSHAYDNTDCNRTGGVDTRVDAYLEWIDQEMRERCDDGTRVWCEVPGILPPPDALESEDEEEDGKNVAGSEEDGEEAGLLACGCATGSADGTVVGGLLVGLAMLRRRRQS